MIFRSKIWLFQESRLLASQIWFLRLEIRAFWRSLLFASKICFYFQKYNLFEENSENMILLINKLSVAEKLILEARIRRWRSLEATKAISRAQILARPPKSSPEAHTRHGWRRNIRPSWLHSPKHLSTLVCFQYLPSSIYFPSIPLWDEWKKNNFTTHLFSQHSNTCQKGVWTPRATPDHYELKSYARHGYINVTC